MGTVRSTQKLLAIGKEIVDGVLRIGGIFVVGFFFMYGNVFTLMVEEITTGSSRTTEDAILLPSVTKTSRSSSAGVSLSDLPSLGSGLPTHGVAAVTDRFHAPTLDRYLQNRLAVYQTPFSLLPPGKRLRIHRLGVDAPVVDVEYASAEQMQNGEFDEQLSQGVVKYPFTSEPGNTGNTLIFGHSSVDFWETKSNPFGFIFSHLHDLEIGDTIELVWNSQQYLYSVEETVIKKPNQINEVLQQFKEGKYLTLMACYPRFSTAQRILVVAKAISNEEYEKKRLAASTNQVLN